MNYNVSVELKKQGNAMSTTSSFTEYQQQLLRYQEDVINFWLNPFSPSQTKSSVSETWEKMLELQEETVKKLVDTPLEVAQSIADSQRKYWDNYFNLLRKPLETKNTVG